MNILYNKILSYLFITYSFLFSVSAPPFTFEVEQPDGSKIPVRMYGHEYYNWMETEDGYVIDFVENADYFGWYYSKLDEHGKFTSSITMATYPAPIDLDIPKRLQEVSPTVRNLNDSFSNSGYIQNDHLNRGIVDSTLKPLIFLVKFGDQQNTYSADQFNHLLFADNLSPESANFPLDHTDYTMSVRDYYYEISNGKQKIIGDIESVVDWRTAKYNYSHYVDGAQGTGEGTNGVARSAAALVVETALSIDDSFDFRQFDNGEGAIDVVILIVAGKGGQSNNHFWPHMYMVPTQTSGLTYLASDEYINDLGYFSIDGVVIQKYIVIQEKYGWNHSGAKMDMIHPIGTICHELGHVLGIPDLYDTSDNSAAGIGEWGLMASGNWQSQTNPSYMSAWSRYSLGYIEPTFLYNLFDAQIDILPAEEYEEAVAYILPMNSNMPQEYLIIENRQKQQSGADQELEKSGLLVWHIDETITDMYPALNSVNVNPDFYGVNLLQADGLGELYSNCNSCADGGDPFPFGSHTSLSGSTNPNTDIYSYDRDADGKDELGGDSGIELRDIQDSDGIITMTVSNPNLQGHILAYDEGNFEGVAYYKLENQLEWIGIRVTATDTALLAGVATVFPPSSSNLAEVTNFTINIWKGWTINNQPNFLLCGNNIPDGECGYTYVGNVQWSPEELRDGGWAYISLLNKGIILNKGDEYYVEINNTGTGAMYFFDQGIYSNSTADAMSYYRGRTQDSCTPLNSLPDAQNGDWNIRVVLSGSDDLELLSNDLSQIPQEHRIDSNFPNPFNPHTIFPVYLASPEFVKLDVYDLIGRLVDYHDFSMLSVGYYEFKINFNHLSSGIYFYQFTISGEKQSPMKMVLLK